VAESVSWQLPDPAATAQLGAQLARVLLDAAPARLVLYFEGELGAGKTALIRAMLAGLGHTGRVPSPTYTLVEPYLVAAYRDLVDELGRGSLLLAEWPSRGAGRMPPADLKCQLALEGAGRQVHLTALSEAGFKLLRKMHQALPAGF
jgi:tRNA threonylcarbamoyladenosine biosynthesis protein TsaE